MSDHARRATYLVAAFGGLTLPGCLLGEIAGAVLWSVGFLSWVLVMAFVATAAERQRTLSSTGRVNLWIVASLMVIGLAGSVAGLAFGHSLPYESLRLAGILSGLVTYPFEPVV